MERLVPVTIHKVMQTRSYTAIILQAETKQFVIYTESSSGKLLQLYLTEQDKMRPMTHELIELILKGLGGKLVRIVIDGLKDNVYFTKLYLLQEIEGIKRIIEVDARPSDAIALAILCQTPVFSKQDVLEATLSLEET